MIGGSVESISLDGANYAVPADTDITITMGGFQNEVMPNGDGTARIKKERFPWKAAGVVLSISFEDGDPAFLQNLADRKDPFPIIITFADDSTLTGTGTIQGELTESSMDSTASMELAGSGTLTQ